MDVWRIGRANLVVIGMTALSGMTLVGAGSYSFFTANSATTANFTAGTVKIAAWRGSSCTPPASSDSSQGIPSHYFSPDNTQTETYTVENTGTLDEWIGLITQVPSNIPLDVSYTVDVYQPTDVGNETGDPDENGDDNSNNHTGHFGNGAGGEDENSDASTLTQSDTVSSSSTIQTVYDNGTLNQGSPSQNESENGAFNSNNTTFDTTHPWYQSHVDWYSVSNMTPDHPFELPVGYVAQFTVNIKLDVTAQSEQFQDKTDTFNLNVWAVQYRNNVDSVGTAPLSWAPQPSSLSTQVSLTGLSS